MTPVADGDAGRQRQVVVEVGTVLEQVVGAVVGGRTRLAGQAAQRGASADASGDVAGFAAQDLEQARRDPLLGVGCSLVVEAVRRGPQVLDNVDHIEDDRHLDPASGGGLLDQLELGLVAVDQDHPRLVVLRVAPLGLVEHLLDDRGRGLLNARPDALVLGPGAGHGASQGVAAVAVEVADDVLGRPVERGDGVNGRPPSPIRRVAVFSPLARRLRSLR
jgi:hypothetical protein